MVNKRFLEIIRLLLKHDDYITIDEISKQLNVSNKTIRNDLQQVGEWLKENDLNLVKKTGVGVTIEGNKTIKLNVYHSIKKKNDDNFDYSPQGRRIYIGMKLVLDTNCRIYELANDLYVSRATIHKDIAALTFDLQAHKLQLYRKNNNGLRIEGSEKNLRHFLIELMSNDNGYSIFTKMVQDTKYICDGSLLFPALDFNDDEVLELLQVLEAAANPYLHSLLFTSLVQVMLYITVTYIRVQEKHYISLSDSFIKELSFQPYFKDVEQLVNVIEEHYHIKFPEMEKRYLQVFFISLQNTDHIPESDQKEAIEITKLLIKEWGHLLNLDFTNDEELYHVTFSHICPAITRFRHNITIENPLIVDIESIYANTFAIVKKSVYIIEDFYQCKVSDEETGFLALHLAAALDRIKKPLNTIIVSHGSIGATNLLANKIKTQFPELKIISVKSNITIYDTDLDDIDLILSTTELLIDKKIPMLTINTLLYDYDITRLRSIIKTYFKQKNDPDIQIQKSSSV